MKIDSFIGHIIIFNSGNKYLRVDADNWYRYIGPSLAKQGRDTKALEHSFQEQERRDFELDKYA